MTDKERSQSSIAPPRNEGSNRRAANLSHAKFEKRLRKLEKVMAELSETSGKSSATSAESVRSSAVSAVTKERKFWAINAIEEAGAANGGVVFAGHITLPIGETYAWQIEEDTDQLLAADWSVAHTALSALAHPMRLTILRALLHGERNTQSLQALPNMGTTGQLYHHLKELETAGWIRQPRRGEYQVLAERVVPLLTIVSTCEITQN
jgi:hypothetical protein